MKKSKVKHVAAENGRYTITWHNGQPHSSGIQDNSIYDFIDADEETIIYDNVNRKGLNRHLSNNCYHVAYKSRWYPAQTRIFTADIYMDTENYYQCSYYSTLLPQKSLTYSSLPEDLEDFNSRAFQAMLPDLEQGLSLTNFLFELTDFRHIMSLFSKWEGLTNKVAEGHLSWQFGVKPFREDVKKLHKVLVDHQSILEDFVTRTGTVQKRYYREKLPVVETDSGWQGLAGLYHLRARAYLKEHCKYNATMTYMYTCPDMNEWKMKVKALLDMLGLRLTPSVIWEAIPFSFVVDWFFRVQDYLEQFEDPLVPVTCTVIDYTISVKHTYHFKRDSGYWANPTGSAWSDQVEVEEYSKTYHRRRTLPNSGTAFINRGQFGRNQLALSASLLKVRF